jgi:hypothetical protein
VAQENQSKVRVSIGNLAWELCPEGGSGIPFAILNSAKRQYAALGGGAMLTEVGKQYLEGRFGATGFEFDKHTGFFDARFVVDESMCEKVFEHFAGIAGKSNNHEHNPTLDILAELTGSEQGHQSILPERMLGLAKLEFLKVVRQKPAASGADTSARAIMQTRRLFRIYRLYLYDDAAITVCNSKQIKFLTNEELASTNGGSTAGMANDGVPMQNNLFLA